MKTTILFLVMTTVAGAVALSSRPASEPAMERVSLDELNAEVDARLKVDLQRVAREAAVRAAALRPARGVRLAAR